MQINNLSHFTFSFQQGEIEFFPKGCYKKAEVTPGTPLRFYSLVFLYESLEGPIELELQRKYRFGPMGTKLLDKDFQDIAKVWERRQAGYLAKSRALVLLLLHRLLSLASHETNTPTNDEQTIKQYIEEHFEQPLTVRELSKLVNLHPVYLGNKFKKVYGSTIKEYLHQIRIEHAISLIEKEILSLGEVDEFCGYSDVFYFSKQFKALTSVHPSYWLSQKKPK